MGVAVAPRRVGEKTFGLVGTFAVSGADRGFHGVDAIGGGGVGVGAFTGQVERVGEPVEYGVHPRGGSPLASDPLAAGSFHWGSLPLVLLVALMSRVLRESWRRADASEGVTTGAGRRRVFRWLAALAWRSPIWVDASAEEAGLVNVMPVFEASRIRWRSCRGVAPLALTTPSNR